MHLKKYFFRVPVKNHWNRNCRASKSTSIIKFQWFLLLLTCSLTGQTVNILNEYERKGCNYTVVWTSIQTSCQYVIQLKVNVILRSKPQENCVEGGKRDSISWNGTAIVDKTKKGDLPFSHFFREKEASLTKEGSFGLI